MSDAIAMPTRLGRNFTLAILAGVFLILLAIATGPHIWRLEQSRRIDEISASAQQLENEARQLSMAKQRLELLSNPKIAELMLLKGATAGLNGALLQKQVAEIAARAGINPHSLRVADPQNWKSGLRNITLEIGMRATLKQLQTFMFDVETRLPLMFIENLNAALPDAERSEGDEQVEKNLDITIIVRGIALAENTQ